jgi:hypothetical protein
MNATDTIDTSRSHPLENRVLPPLVVVLTGAAMAVSAWLTPAAEIENVVRFGIGGCIIAL